jgi:hypothetical protein
MSKGPGHITVTTEVGYCNFCGRPRNLRREERQLGELVRTNVTCESCHRTLFSTMGVATAVQEGPLPAAAATEPAAEPAATATAAAKPQPAAAKAKPAAAKPKPAPKRAAKGR